MKLKNVFKLYKSYYPSAEPYRVTIAGCGAVQVSDSRCASRLCVGAAPGVHRFLSDRDEVVRTGDNVSAALLGSYFYDNRREFFMMGETRSLYGIVYAENLTTDLQFMAMMRPASFSAGPTGGIRLTWLFALADCVSQSRYSLSSLTVERTGSVLVVTTTAGGSSCLRLTPGGNLLTPDGNALLPTGRKGDDIARYTRLFHRDNAKWLADFADGKEDSL